MNGNDYHSVATGCEIEIGNDGDDRYLPCHCHDVNAVAGRDGRPRGRLNKWVSVARKPQNDVSEKMLVKKG